MSIRSRFHILLLLSVILLPSLRGQFYTLQTKTLRLVYYTKSHEFLVPHVARCFENAFRFHSKLFDYTPSEKVTLILQDFGDYAGGGANTVPFNLIGIGIAPFSYAYETMPPIERFVMMMNHELVHVVTTDKPSPNDAFWRSVFFGKVVPVPEAPMSALYAYLTNPRWNAPRWFIEGIAVFLETWMGGGLGRALGAYDEMVFRTMVLDTAYFYDVVGLESEGTKVDFQVGAASYLYGTRFISYLSFQYGPDKVIDWFSQTSVSSGYFSSDFKRVFGKPLDDVWSEWITFEHQWQRTNLDSIRRYPITPVRPLTTTALGSVSRAYYDSSDHVLYAAMNYPGQRAHIAAIDVRSGAIRRLQDIRGPALFFVCSLAYDPDSKTLFYTTDNNDWRDIVALDIRTGDTRMIMKDFRAGDLAFCRADKSLWAMRHFNGISTLVKIPYPYTEWKQLLSFDYGKDFFDIDVSPDGKYVTGALAEIDGSQLLIRMETGRLLAGDKSHEVLFDFENSTPANFAHTSDGRFLFGTSYFSGVSNIVRYDFEQKDMSFVSNCESGLFRVVPISSDSLVAFLFSGKGFQPVMLANRTVSNINATRYFGQAVVERHPVLRSWALKPPSPASINIDSLTVSTEEYSAFGTMRVASIYPIAEGFKEFPSYGLRMNLSDPILFHNIDVTASYSPNRLLPHNERFHASFNYKILNWKLSGTYNGADFYDLFGPTKISRKGYSLSLQYKDFIIFDEPEIFEYHVKVAGYAGLERLPDFQNVSTSFDRFYSLNGRLNYHNVARSLGAVDDETGFLWDFVSHTNLVSKKVFPRFSSDAAYGFLLPINHSSIWFRGSAGYSFGNRNEPFANFYFGGFGNNWVDIGEIRRYREAGSLPGLEINQVGGTNYAKGMIEWELPPIRFRSFGFQSFYCNWSRIAFFSAALATNMDNAAARRSAATAGGQIDFRLVIFSSLESTFSLGYGVAAEENQRLSDDFMISLKILK